MYVIMYTFSLADKAINQTEISGGEEDSTPGPMKEMH